MQILTKARRVASRCLLPIARRAAKAYVSGELLEDALRVSEQLNARGLGISLAYWNFETDLPREVANEYLAGVEALAGQEHAYLSIKVPSIGYSQQLLSEIVERAVQNKVRLHFDAVACESADRSRALFDRALESGAELSYTLPGRWVRSVQDADWAIERGVVVRVVKGQWVDPSEPHRDLRQGFLEVIDALAGKARHVAVASHDVPLASEAINRLRSAGTSCEIELLYGLPMRPSLQLADWLALGVHVYVPYGKAYLPYAMSKMRSNPRLAWWLLRDFLAAQCAGKSSERRAPELMAR